MNEQPKRIDFDETDRAPRQMFRFSLLYLSVLFAALIVDRLAAQAGLFA